MDDFDAANAQILSDLDAADAVEEDLTLNTPPCPCTRCKADRKARA